MHSHESIVAVAPASFGRRHKLSVSVGTDEREAPFSKEAEQFFGYLPPTVTGFETSASQSGENAAVFSPDGKTRLTLLGYNLGFVTGGSEAEANFSSMVTVQIGTEFDVDGSYCGDEERCMKLCEDPRWFPTKLKGEDSTLGFPYIDCIIPVDTAGFKNISVSIAGQIDDCRTNRLLCGLPINFPVDRRQRPLGSTERISDLVNDASKGLSGLVFTCAKSSQAAQSYAKPGELCQDEPNGVCADADCTAPKANPGFWRLDLDLQFACNQGTALSTEEADGGLQVLPCQADYAKLLSSASNEKSVGATVMSALNPFDTSGGNTGVSLEQVCAAGIQQGTGNRTQCAPDYRLCSDRGTNPPGSCIFRRPEEARRALGSEFWPWACPEVDMTELMKSSDVPEQAKKNAMRACRSAAPDAFGYVESLSMPNCPAKRTKHLVDPSVYRQYPGLEQSTTCYGIVACNPKESCLGDNKCAPGYEYNKHRCEAWNAANPGRSNCTSDDDCRSRSGRVAASNGASAGLSSACDHNNPEDCARCVVDDTTGLGTCECMGGGPRCGLCRLAGGGIDPATGKKYKGYYRLNDECQECPENPALLIALMVLALVAFCVIGWWMQDKKVNVAFLSIGVDYFQVLAIFARIKVRWPLWVKQILQVLSVFNFNIDIAAPECIMPDFDYRIKWIMMMSLPLMFAAMLWMINCTICLKKWIGFRFLGRSRPKYSSHGGKLVAMFIVVFYFAYLTVTRRALDIFNCNPAVPDDGYLYTEFTSIDCPGGTCICDDPAGLQYALKPWAVAGFCIYSLGFPAFVAFITWYYHYQIKADQLLRAYNMGDERSRTRVYITQRGCFRSIDRNMYDIRKKYHKLYYHFKPGKVYWMLVILARKLLVALFALLFRRNVAFLLSCVLLVLFGSYVLQVRNKPYMSQVERADVREAHRQKVLDAEAEIGRLMTVERVVSEHAAEEKLRPDLRTHLQINRGINAIEDEIRKRDIRRGTVAHQNVSSAIKAARDRKTLKVRLADYYFDYNTVEQILIMCSIFLSLVAIMFESGQFYKIDPATGLEKLDDDPSTSAFYTTILVFGAIALIGSLVYYSIVLVSEVFGHAPNWLRKLCATKTNALQKRDARAVGMGMGRGDSLDDGNFEMAETHLTQYANPLKDLEAAKASEKEAQEKAERFKKMFEKSEARSGEMVDMVRKLKQKNARQSLDANARSRAGTKQTAGAQARSKPKKEFAAQLKK